MESDILVVKRTRSCGARVCTAERCRVRRCNKKNHSLVIDMRLWISSREIRPVSNSLFLQPRRLRTKYSQHGMNAHQSRGANQMTSDLTHCVTGAQLDLRGDNNTLGVILSSSTVKGLRRSSGSALKVPASSHLVHLLSAMTAGFAFATDSRPMAL